MTNREYWERKRKKAAEKYPAFRRTPEAEAELQRIYAAMERYPRKPGEKWRDWCNRAMWYDEIDFELANPVIPLSVDKNIDTSYDICPF